MIARKFWTSAVLLADFGVCCSRGQYTSLPAPYIGDTYNWTEGAIQLQARSKEDVELCTVGDIGSDFTSRP